MELFDRRIEEQIDAMGRVRRTVVQTVAVHNEMLLKPVLSRMDKALELVGRANVLCHLEHWVEKTETGWTLNARGRAMPSLRDHLAQKQMDQPELIALSSDPRKAAQELRLYRESLRLPDETIIRLGLDICTALEQAGQAGLDRCQVTQDTIYCGPGGRWLLGDVHIAPEGDVNTDGLALVMHQLLGGTETELEPPFGGTKLCLLVKQAREDPLELATMRKRLEWLAGDRPQPEENPKPISERNPHTWQSAGGTPEKKPEPRETLADIIRKKVHLSAMLSAGDGFTAAVCRNGTVSSTRIFAGLAGWTGIRSVAVGGSHMLGLREDGRLRVVGNNFNGQCDVSGWTDIIQIGAGMSYSIGLRSDGTVQVAGQIYNNWKQNGAWSNIAAIAAGNQHIVGLRSDGTVVAGGNTQQGECNVYQWRDIVAVSAGGMHTVGLKMDGTVVATGANLFGQCNVENWTDIVAVEAGTNHTVGLKADGTVVAVGNFSFGACAVGDWTNIIAISAGWSTTVGLRSDGKLVAKGKNDYGQCDVSHWRGLI